MKRALFFAALILFMGGPAFSQGFEHFITRQGDKLMDGPREFRFISFNIPNLHYVEDDMAFSRKMPFRFPDEFEITDALVTIKQMGGQVARTYTLPVFQESAPKETPKYVEGPGRFNEEAFRTLDLVLALANKHQVRLIIPIVNNFQWWGGAVDYAAFRGKPKDEFWTDPEVIGDFKKTIEFLLNRVNTITGVPYREDKSILAWETGNETQCPHSWTKEIAAYIKSLDSNHLLVDGYFTSVLRVDSIADENVDIVQTHHYEGDPRLMLSNIRASRQLAAGKKPYMLGEFGFITSEGVRAVLDETIHLGLSGALIWSLRYHHREGGFFWHSEPSGGDFFKAYHWPGFDSGEVYDEANLMAIMRQKAYQIQGLDAPPLPVPAAPRLLPGGAPLNLSWQGSVGAASYRVERAESAEGPWQEIARGVSDAQSPHRPLFNDADAEIGKSYYYRIRGENSAGVSAPSNVEGPLNAAHHLFVDELKNDSQTFFHAGAMRIRGNESRKYKEDFHRLHGDAGAWILYKVDGPIDRVQAYAFSEQDSPVAIALSADGRNFTSAAAEVVDYRAGEGDYGYLVPTVSTVTSLNPDVRFVKVEFVKEGALSRVEITYGD